MKPPVPLSGWTKVKGESLITLFRASDFLTAKVSRVPLARYPCAPLCPSPGMPREAQERGPGKRWAPGRRRAVNNPGHLCQWKRRPVVTAGWLPALGLGPPPRPCRGPAALTPALVCCRALTSRGSLPAPRIPRLAPRSRREAEPTRGSGRPRRPRPRTGLPLQAGSSPPLVRPPPPPAQVTSLFFLSGERPSCSILRLLGCAPRTVRLGGRAKVSVRRGRI